MCFNPTIVLFDLNSRFVNFSYNNRTPMTCSKLRTLERTVHTMLHNFISVFHCVASICNWEEVTVYNHEWLRGVKVWRPITRHKRDRDFPANLSVAASRTIAYTGQELQRMRITDLAICLDKPLIRERQRKAPCPAPRSEVIRWDYTAPFHSSPLQVPLQLIKALAFLCMASACRALLSPIAAFISLISSHPISSEMNSAEPDSVLLFSPVQFRWD